ncbi:MAG: PEP-CTERM sorting domain-containing protein, partial [Okeania sp. SIO3B3]|nr:PEP-CTERM sorting domain-containing protein [Okeania sp. SIO3B3]
FQITGDLTKLDSILQGDSSNPGDYIELGTKNAKFGSNLLGGVQAQNAQGETVTFTNVTQNIYESSDWRDEVGRAWFSDAWEQAVEKNSDVSLVSTDREWLFYNIFVDEGGLDIITNPNISYINEVGDDIVVGLAGDLNLGNRFSHPFLSAALDGVQMSGIFAYDINGDDRYAWSSVVTTELTSEIGNFEVVLEGAANGYVSEEVPETSTEDVPELSTEDVPETSTEDVPETSTQDVSDYSPEDIPEPSTVLGLIAIGGLVAATKRKLQK